MAKRFTDIHHHLLYGIDDGPESSRKMYAMLRRAEEQGVNRIVATPHVTPGVKRFNRKQYDKALQDARDYCARKGFDIEIFEGAEILYTDQSCRHLQEDRVPTLAGTDRVLVEFSPDVRFERMREALRRLASGGFSPVVAHVERYQCLVRWPARAERLKDEINIYYQVNCSTIIRCKGFFVRRFMRRMLDYELIDAVASDAHNTTSRPLQMRKAWSILRRDYGSEYARQLTDGSLLFDD